MIVAVQSTRRWRSLLTSAFVAGICFLAAILSVKSVFLTAVQGEAQPPLTSADILSAIPPKTVVGYAPNSPPFNSIMRKAAELLDLGTDLMNATSEDDLNDQLYSLSRGTLISYPIIWVIWNDVSGGVWGFKIRNTELARLEVAGNVMSNSHLRTGFLSVQLAVSQSIIEYNTAVDINYSLSLVSMPVTPMMRKSLVKEKIITILIYFTGAFILPIIDIDMLVVKETTSHLKRGLFVRDVSYTEMYIGWLFYALLTVLPVCFLGGFTLTFLFRWINLIPAVSFLLCYATLIIVLCLIICTFHSKAWVACLWTVIFSLVQTLLAQLFVLLEYEKNLYNIMSWFFYILVPALGLVHEFYQFALLEISNRKVSLFVVTMTTWSALVLLYFCLLLLLQRTVRGRAVGGQESWKSIIFKQAEDTNKLHYVRTPTGKERDNIQEVDELVAKAISFKYVTKSIMDRTIVKELTFDIYRGEFTMMAGEKIQKPMLDVVEDLLTGATSADSGSINVLGTELTKSGPNIMTMPYMIGYCQQSDSLMDFLTVLEHIEFYCDISLWSRSRTQISEFIHERTMYLLMVCDLDGVRHHYVKDLHDYYKAQLCWAIALIMEPRVVIVPHFTDSVIFKQVIRDKIMFFKKHLTVVKMCLNTVQIESCDRIFLFDNSVLVFGGTPAYMFFKYGCEYFVRISFRENMMIDESSMEEIMTLMRKAQGSLRADLGSLLVLRVPGSPTAAIAEFVKVLAENAEQYGITSFHLSLPDIDEVCRRAVYESRKSRKEESSSSQKSKAALNRIGESPPWTRKKPSLFNRKSMKYFGRKYSSFFVHFKFHFFALVAASVVVGVFIGINMGILMRRMDNKYRDSRVLKDSVLIVERSGYRTNLIMRSDNSSDAINVANAYVLSHTGVKEVDTESISYTVLKHPESLTEYLVTRAIDSPERYVYLYACGLDLYTDSNGQLVVRALYSPLHRDHKAAARSLARAHTALLRHYSGAFDEALEIDDHPLYMDMPMVYMNSISRFETIIYIQILLIITTVHMTLLPSKEHGLIRHTQSNAINFSPFKYWLSMFICDVVLYGMLVTLIALIIMMCILFMAPETRITPLDLFVIGMMLFVFGIGCIPQAYLFSLGPRPMLNSLMFVGFSIMFGQTTILTKILYGNTLNYVLHFMGLSPQFNIVYALIKIFKIFTYNRQCTLYQDHSLCTNVTFHVCCEKCGILQECYKKQFYFTRFPGIAMEAIGTILAGCVYMVILLLFEYQHIKRLCIFIMTNWIYHDKSFEEHYQQGVIEERSRVVEKKKEILSKKVTNPETDDSFGGYLLADKVTKKEDGVYVCRDVTFGLSRGEVLGLLGPRGRMHLVELLAGYRMQSMGSLWCMSKHNLKSSPHAYTRHATLSCKRESLPAWMTVREAVKLVALLRGVPDDRLKSEVQNLIEALELTDKYDTLVCDLKSNDMMRMHFVAAVIGAPPIVIIDECTAFQKFSTRRAIYFILHHLRMKGHSIILSSPSAEIAIPIADRIAILRDGELFDIDSESRLVERYSLKGFTVVVDLKDDVDMRAMFARYFTLFHINDVSDVLANVQVYDDDLDYPKLFEKMEKLLIEHRQVNSYRLSVVPVDCVYKDIVTQETGYRKTRPHILQMCLDKIFPKKPQKKPTNEDIAKLVPFEKKYSITKLTELPWSVIFNR